LSCSKPFVIASQFKKKDVQIVFIYLQQQQVLLELKMTCGQILSSLANQKYVQITLFVVLLLSFLLEFISQGSTPRKKIGGGV